MRSTLDRKKNRKIMPPIEPATSNHAPFFISVMVCTAAEGNLTRNSAHPNNAMSMSVSRTRSTRMVERVEDTLDEDGCDRRRQRNAFTPGEPERPHQFTG